MRTAVNTPALKTALCFIAGLSTIAANTALATEEATPMETILITNARIFDGKSDKLTEPMSVLVEGNKITKIGKTIAAPEGATVIDAKGRTITPGLIDAHVHLTWNMSPAEMFHSPPDYIASMALVEAKATLMRGYTSVRDISGQVVGIKKAIDQGHFAGPRIWSSGAGLSMSAGHGDVKTNYMRPRQLGGAPWTDVEYIGMSVIADGVPEVLSAARLQFRKGADFLKMYTSGAVSGVYDPLDIGEYSFDEIKAAADEAKRWNTYLAVHTYNDKGTQQAVEAGAMSIEHATIITEPTVKLIAEKGAFLSSQTGVYLSDAAPDWSEDQKSKQRAAKEGLDNLFNLAKKYNVKIALGTDIVGPPELKKQQAYELTNRLKWFTPAQILHQATASNAELLSWSGPRNPYPGKLGVIEEGALADILLVNGNPLENLKLFNNPEESLVLIMKDGKIYKNTVK
ncbi:amidohydrolase family protein [Petrachloros mirabilis]